MSELIDKFRSLEVMKYATVSVHQMKKMKEKVNNGEYILTEKLDGFFYRASWTNKDNFLLQGRSRTVSGDFSDKGDNVPHIQKELLELFPPNCMFLGEISYGMGVRSESKDITKIMNCLPKKAIERQKADRYLKYTIFDVLVYDGVDFAIKPYQERINLINSFALANNHLMEHIEVVVPYSDPVEIWNKMDQWLSTGLEGGMLMAADDPYFFGKRPTWTSVKFKEIVEEDIDLVIMDYSPPVKNYTGKQEMSWTYWETSKGELCEGKHYGKAGFTAVSKHYFNNNIGGLILGAYYGKELIKVCQVANLTDELREAITSNKEKYLNTTVQVGAMSVDKKLKSLRHPRLMKLRPDKPAADCRYEEIF